MTEARATAFKGSAFQPFSETGVIMEEETSRDIEFLKNTTTEYTRLWSFSDLDKILSKKDHKKVKSITEHEESFDRDLEAIERHLQRINNEDSDSDSDSDSPLKKADDSLLMATESCKESKRLIDRASLLLGYTEDLKDVRNLQDLDLSIQVYQHLFKQFQYLLRSQMCIPLMLNGRNIVLIAPPGSRKTSGYLIALASIALSSKSTSSEPECVIIAPNSTRINHLSRLINHLFAGSIQVVTSTGNSAESQNHDEIIKGCNILITSPSCFLKLYGEVITAERLLNITFDSASELFSTFHREINEIYKKTKAPQYIIVSSKYHPGIAKLIDNLDNPVFCSTSFMESALYAGLRSSLILTKKSNKMAHVSKLLGDKLSKIIIVCSNSQEVDKLNRKFSNQVLTIYEHSTLYMPNILKMWNTRKVLICSDHVLYDLQITDADCLIHYSIPKSLDIFSHRYSVLKDKFTKKILNDTILDCRAFILVDEKGLAMLPKIYKYVTFFENDMPKEVKEITKDVLEIKEFNKKSKICLDIVKYGFCRKKCQERHIFARYRDINIIPDYKYIAFVVTCIHDLSHYSARISEYSYVDVLKRNFKNQFIPLPSEFAKLSMEMSDFFQERENRIPGVNLSLGDLVMVQKEVDLLFLRGKIMKILYDRSNFVSKYVVKLIDQGEIRSLAPSKVFLLPRKFCEVKPQVVDIFISNLLPYEDTTWSPVGTLELRKQYEMIENEGFYMMSVGKVNMVLGEYVIVEDWMIHNMDGSFTSRRFSAREFILKNKYGVQNQNHISNLNSLCLPDPLKSGPTPKFNYDMNLFL